MDEGFAHWKAGDHQAALECLVAGVTAIDALPPDEEASRIYLVRKWAGHTLMWIAAVTNGRPPDGYSAPPPACCSLPENIQAPPTPSHALWVHLIDFEIEAGLGDATFRAHEDALAASPYGLLRMSFDLVRIRQRLLYRSLTDFVEVVADWAEALEICRLYYGQGALSAADLIPEGAPPIDRSQLNAESMQIMMVSAIFALIAQRPATKKDLEVWRAAARSAGVASALEPWVDFVEQALVARTVNAQIAMRTAGLPWTLQVVATLAVSEDPAVSMADLMTVHGFWVAALYPAKSALHVLRDVETLVVEAWRRVAQQTFRLRNPRVTGPALIQACDSPSTGWKKIGEVLLAAADAIPATVPQDMLNAFRRLLMG